MSHQLQGKDEDRWSGWPRLSGDVVSSARAWGVLLKGAEPSCEGHDRLGFLRDHLLPEEGAKTRSDQTEPHCRGKRQTLAEGCSALQNANEFLSGKRWNRGAEPAAAADAANRAAEPRRCRTVRGSANERRGRQHPPHSPAR